MLDGKDAMATVAVRDLAAAAKFYEVALGLKRLGTEGEEAIVYATGSSKLLVYRSQYAGTNKATAVTWNVGDVDGTVRALKAEGVRFEHYDLPGTSREGDVHAAGTSRFAWFTDPDGNIHALVSG